MTTVTGSPTVVHRKKDEPEGAVAAPKRLHVKLNKEVRCLMDSG